RVNAGPVSTVGCSCAIAGAAITNSTRATERYCFIVDLAANNTLCNKKAQKVEIPLCSFLCLFVALLDVLTYAQRDFDALALLRLLFPQQLTTTVNSQPDLGQQISLAPLVENESLRRVNIRRAEIHRSVQNYRRLVRDVSQRHEISGHALDRVNTRLQRRLPRRELERNVNFNPAGCLCLNAGHREP